MSDKILLIEDLYGFSYKNEYGCYDGIHIKTEKNEIYFLIENCQNCCEQWGYLSSNDDYNKFIGAEYKGYDNITSEKLKDIIIDKTYDEECARDSIFLNVNTDKGMLQFAVYNSHNGYYGHSVLRIVNGNIEMDSI